jgi:hypothetical protein
LLPLQVDEPSLIIYSDKVTNHLSVHCPFGILLKNGW